MDKLVDLKRNQTASNSVFSIHFAHDALKSLLRVIKHNIIFYAKVGLISQLMMVCNRRCVILATKIWWKKVIMWSIFICCILNWSIFD